MPATLVIVPVTLLGITCHHIGVSYLQMQAVKMPQSNHLVCKSASRRWNQRHQADGLDVGVNFIWAWLPCNLWWMGTYYYCLHCWYMECWGHIKCNDHWNLHMVTQICCWYVEMIYRSKVIRSRRLFVWGLSVLRCILLIVHFIVDLHGKSETHCKRASWPICSY